MNFLFETPLFGILLTFLTYLVSRKIYLRFKKPWLNPIFLSLLMILGFLTLSGISVGQYMIGGSVISRFLPVTVTILALPLYKQLALLRRYWKALLVGTGSGVIGSLVSVIILGFFLNIPPDLVRSLLPKSITTPLGVVMADMLGVNQSFTVIAIVATGIIGVLVYPLTFRIFKITEPVAQGLALGTASHAIGTSKAIELGEQEGAMASLAIIVTGLVTLFMTPLLFLFMPAL